ncbi:MAG: N-acetylmuramoyl-L-alanine amidase [Bacteroidota bacterium]|nr:N-acetylmuramoyl-L-alanine amidase [Bacteroidota bacterium]
MFIINSINSDSFLNNCDELNIEDDVLQLKGWALSRDGIESIEIYMNFQLIGRCVPQIAREDVYNIYPDFPDALNCGYSFTRSILTCPVVKGNNFLNLKFITSSAESYQLDILFESDIQSSGFLNMNKQHIFNGITISKDRFSEGISKKVFEETDLKTKIMKREIMKTAHAFPG